MLIILIPATILAITIIFAIKCTDNWENEMKEEIKAEANI